jgi:cytochrome P450 monooxygenase
MIVQISEIWASWSYLLCFAALLFIPSKGLKRFHRFRRQKAHGCEAIPSYPQWDPFLGSDIAFSMARALKTHRYLNWLRELHAKAGSKTFTINFLGTRFIHTIEPENMKALSAVNWKDFGVEPMRRLNKASMPFADKGVNTTDGHSWAMSRVLIKPYFMREAFSNTDRLEKHTDNLMDLIPLDGSTFDMQILLQRWVC